MHDIWSVSMTKPTAVSLSVPRLDLIQDTTNWILKWFLSSQPDLHGNYSNKQSWTAPSSICCITASVVELVLWSFFLSPHFTYSAERRSTMSERLFVEWGGSHTVMRVASGIGSSGTRLRLHFMLAVWSRPLQVGITKAAMRTMCLKRAQSVNSEMCRSYKLTVPGHVYHYYFHFLCFGRWIIQLRVHTQYKLLTIVSKLWH